MWIVQLTLRRPYTFIVAALLLLIVSPLVILRTPAGYRSEHQHLSR
jgi:hypothetical protein